MASKRGGSWLRPAIIHSGHAVNYRQMIETLSLFYPIDKTRFTSWAIRWVGLKLCVKSLWTATASSRRGYWWWRSSSRPCASESRTLVNRSRRTRLRSQRPKALHARLVELGCRAESIANTQQLNTWSSCAGRTRPMCLRSWIESRTDPSECVRTLFEKSWRVTPSRIRAPGTVVPSNAGSCPSHKL